MAEKRKSKVDIAAEKAAADAVKTVKDAKKKKAEKVEKPPVKPPVPVKGPKVEQPKAETKAKVEPVTEEPKVQPVAEKVEVKTEELKTETTVEVKVEVKTEETEEIKPVTESIPGPEPVAEQVQQGVDAELAAEEKAEAEADPKGDPTINPVIIFNIAVGYRESIEKEQVSPEMLYEQCYGEKGVIKDLKAYIPKLPIEKRAEFKELIGLLEKDINKKLNGFSPTGAVVASDAGLLPPTTHASPVLGIPPVAPVATPKKLSFKESLEVEFKKVLDHLTTFKKERVCHVQHVNDFCRLSSGGGYEYTFDPIANKLKGTFGGSQAVVEAEFVINKS